MKVNKRAKSVLFAAAAIPVGAICATLCGAIILVAETGLGAATGTYRGMPDFSAFVGMDLRLMAYAAIPVGAAILPLAYLLFFQHIVLKQVLPILGWLLLGAVAVGIPGMLLAHPIIGAIIGFLAGIFCVLRKAKPEQKPSPSKLVGGLIAILASGVIMTPFTWIAGIFLAKYQIGEVESKLESPAVYQTVATNLALYCQSASLLKLTDEVPGAWMPQPIPQLSEYEDGKFASDSAFVIFGGGFYHYGYALKMSPTMFSPATNYWELYFRSEDSPDAFLTRFTLPESARLSLAVFESNVLSEYSRRIATDPANLNFHKGRIRFLLIYDTSRVRQSCLDCVKDDPDGWWPHLTLALWDSGHGDFTNAAKTFAEFVSRKPSYSHYIYLAWFYQTMNHPDEAVAAIEKAVQYPIIDSDDDIVNSECSGYTVAVSAFRSGKYDTVIRLCDVLLPIRINGDYAKGGLNTLRSAAVNARNGKLETYEPDRNILGMNPYENMDMDTLMGGHNKKL